MNSQCCLCSETLAGDPRRRKKMHGSSCSRSLTVLQELTVNCVLPDLENSCALLCHSCDLCLNKMFMLQEKINELKDYIQKKFKNK